MGSFLLLAEVWLVAWWVATIPFVGEVESERTGSQEHKVFFTDVPCKKSDSGTDSKQEEDHLRC